MVEQDQKTIKVHEKNINTILILFIRYLDIKLSIHLYCTVAVSTKVFLVKV